MSSLSKAVRIRALAGSVDEYLVKAGLAASGSLGCNLVLILTQLDSLGKLSDPTERGSVEPAGDVELHQPAATKAHDLVVGGNTEYASSCARMDLTSSWSCLF